MTVRDRLRELGLEVPLAAKPAFRYRTVVMSGDLAFVSGQLPKTGHGNDLVAYGRLGDGIDLATGQHCARACVLQLVAVLIEELGEEALSRIEQVVQVTGFVASTPDFHDHPKVIDGASELLVNLFGERGAHARAAVGVVALPRKAPVEIAFVLRIGSAAA